MLLIHLFFRVYASLLSSLFFHFPNRSNKIMKFALCLISNPRKNCRWKVKRRNDYLITRISHEAFYLKVISAGCRSILSFVLWLASLVKISTLKETMARRTMILLLLHVIARLFVVASSQHRENLCELRQTCASCLQTPRCIWCSMTVMNIYKRPSRAVYSARDDTR